MLVLDIDTSDVKAKMVNVLVSVMKCKGCGHALSSHYCELIINDNNTSYDKQQHCKTCGKSNGDSSKCYAIIRNDDDLNTPILNFWSWNYYQYKLRPNKQKQPCPKAFKEFFSH
tara:strand:- start:43 stop:384 length:342 start_codon:yes stop_codon:yes gene_type:complete